MSEKLIQIAARLVRQSNLDRGSLNDMAGVMCECAKEIRDEVCQLESRLKALEAERDRLVEVVDRIIISAPAIHVPRDERDEWIVRVTNKAVAARSHEKQKNQTGGE